MAFDFLTAQQNFQSVLPDPSLTIGAKTRPATVEKEAFKTKEDDLTARNNNKNFAKILEAQQKKKDTAKSTDKSEKASDSFKTKESKSGVRTEKSETKDGLARGSADYLLDIAAFNAQIRQLIDEATSLEKAKGDIVTTLDEASLEEEKPNIDQILRLFGLLSPKDDGDAVLSEADEFASFLRLIDDLNADEASLSGLSLEQLSQLQDQIQLYLEDSLDQHELDSLQALTANFVTLAPPRETVSAERTQKSTESSVEHKAGENTLSLSVDSEGHYASARYEDKYDLRYENGRPAPSAEGNADDFEAAMKATLDAQGTGKAAGTSQAQNIGAGEKFILSTSSSGAALNGLVNGGLVTDATGLASAGGMTQGTGATLLSSAASNVITQAQQASQPHPATQAVSMTISKAIKDGEDTNIKLKLNPPELGRVEIKMSIDKDNKTKLVLNIEKPETFLMLQRDADALHRAMADAGLDTQDGLSFELASENDDANPRHDNRQQSSGDNRFESDNEDIIETTMNWQVDPQTGHMHYNIIV